MNKENIQIEKAENGYKAIFTYDTDEIRNFNNILLKQIDEINNLRITHKEEMQIKELLNRINKAIEYIERYSSFIDYLSIDKHKEIGSLEMNNVRELLEILKGDSNE